MNTGILVVNLGTTLSYKKKDVARYLREFLMDERVIDIPFWKRWILVNFIIVPLRTARVAEEYKKLWLENSSPLLVYGISFVKKLQALYPLDKAKVVLAMRYQKPSINQGLEELRKFGAERIIVFPMFPQYASATTGSIAENIMKIVSGWNVVPNIHFIHSYHCNQNYIEVFARKVKRDIEEYHPDHILFSYHGLPERQLASANESKAVYCSYPSCNCASGEFKSRYCYRSACFETSYLIAGKLDLKQGDFTTSFQSRLGKEPWIKPYTDLMIPDLCKKGIKKLLVVSPSFVADCLETTLEIGEQYKSLFMESGGQSFYFTTSLNDDDDWINAAYQIIADNTGYKIDS
jgi:ferrochelatase